MIHLGLLGLLLHTEPQPLPTTNLHTSVLVTIQESRNGAEAEPVTTPQSAAGNVVDPTLEDLIEYLDDQLAEREAPQAPPSGLHFDWPDTGAQGPAVLVRAFVRVSVNGVVEVLASEAHGPLSKEHVEMVQRGLTQAPFLPGRSQGQAVESKACIALRLDLANFSAEVSLIPGRKSKSAAACLQD